MKDTSLSEAARLLGLKGGKANARKHPKSHFAALSRKGAEARWGKSLNIKNKAKREKIS